MTSATAPDRLIAVDLRNLSTEKMSALRRRAMRSGVSISELLAKEIEDLSDRLLQGPSPSHSDTGKESAES